MFQSFPSRVAGYVTEELEYEILQTLPEAERNTFTEAIVQHRRDTKILLTPAERGEPFVVPRLMAQIQGELEFADSDLFMEHHDWSLLDHSPRLAEAEFALPSSRLTAQRQGQKRRLGRRYWTLTRGSHK